MNEDRTESVSLLVTLPSSGSLLLETDRKDTINKLKAKIASSANLNAANFTLSFQGEELGEGDALVGERGFENKSLIQVVMDNKRDDALTLLSKMGWGDKTPQDIYLEIFVTGDDNKYATILNAMLDANKCQDDDALRRVLVEATWRGYTSCLRIILTRTQIDVNSETQQGSFPLIRAAAKGDARIVSLYLDHKADINVRDASGATALLRASMHGCDDVVSLLLDYGADPGIRDNLRRLPADWANINKHDAVARLLAPS